MRKQGEKSRQPYSDEDLIAILSDAPTRANAIKHAARFERTPAAIEMIYKWAMTSPSTIKKRGRTDHAFVSQIRRIAKNRVGWLS
jgi:hypothetical protein